MLSGGFQAMSDFALSLHIEAVDHSLTSHSRYLGSSPTLDAYRCNETASMLTYLEQPENAVCMRIQN